jgi:hypothetical protein
MSPPSPATDELIRALDLYFLDGNVVLSATMTDKSIRAFRVHKSILSLHSPVFSDMFSLSGTNEEDLPTGDTYDGVPLVYMPDRCEDLESFLKVLYNPSYVF